MNETDRIRTQLTTDGWTETGFVSQPNIPFFAIIAKSPEGRIVSGSSYDSPHGAYLEMVKKNTVEGAMEGANV